MIWRSVLSLVAVLLYGWINMLLNPIGTIVAGQLAGKQLESSDSAYVISQFGRFFSDFGIPTVVLLLVLALIWWRYIRKLWSSPAAAMLLLGFAIAAPAQAYYDGQDWPEVIYILPNQSAFWIPDVGDNKTSQKRFMSEEYLAEQKIAAKRFQIQHVKLQKSGWFKDYYVPAGRLILVDRTPQAREWVTANDRGTASKNEGFPCQSTEGLNMGVGISLGVSVLEEDAPKFLYRFGVIQDPKADMSKPEVIFASTYNGRSLAEVTDNVVRKKVLSLVCSEVTKRKFSEGNAQMPAMMGAIESAVTKYLKSVGITMDFIGWADTIEFDKDVQKAVNDKYIAEQLAPHMATLTQLAKNRAIEKWDGRLPWWMPEGLGRLFDGIFGDGKYTAPAPAPKK